MCVFVSCQYTWSHVKPSFYIYMYFQVNIKCMQTAGVTVLNSVQLNHGIVMQCTMWCLSFFFCVFVMFFVNVTGTFFVFVFFCWTLYMNLILWTLNRPRTRNRSVFDVQCDFYLPLPPSLPLSFFFCSFLMQGTSDVVMSGWCRSVWYGELYYLEHLCVGCVICTCRRWATRCTGIFLRGAVSNSENKLRSIYVST